jgi:hypothetical protein
MKSNKSWLEGMRCPKCRNYDILYLNGTALFGVTDAGPVEQQYLDWDLWSSCRCPNCSFSGQVIDFFSRRKRLAFEKHRQLLFEGAQQVLGSVSEDIVQIDSDAAESEAEDAVWVQVWVRVPKTVLSGRVRL